MGWITEHHVLVGCLILYGWLLLLFWFSARSHRSESARPSYEHLHVEVIDPNEEPFVVDRRRSLSLRA